ncbi:MAG: peroxiredoxin [Tissierellia bacterium]|nr:peroxiredoxin [Tissierellia bacterium]
METDFKLESTNGKEVSLEDFKGKPLVLYFYPKDYTKGCTLEAQEFSQLYDQFKDEGVEVVGISKDKIGTHKNFKKKESIPFELLADPQREIHKNYNVLKPAKMYGKDVIKTIRSTFIFDSNMNLIKEYRDVKAPGHAKEVLEFVRENL